MGSQYQSSEDQEIPEVRLWRSVITSTVEEWIYSPGHKKHEAEQFLFHDNKDFPTVCSSAGIDPENLRSRLRKIQAGMGQKPALS
jgi:hypothetical protein